MSDQNPQRVALVTGGAVRVGGAISLALAEAGYDLVVAYGSSAGPAEDVSATVADLGRKCTLVQADLSEPEGAEIVVGAARDSYGRLDLLVNSAASFHARSLLDVDADEWDTVMDLNVRAPHLVVRAAADLLRASGGAVINITDLSAFQPWTEYPHHAVSKAALAGRSSSSAASASQRWLRALIGCTASASRAAARTPSQSPRSASSVISR